MLNITKKFEFECAHMLNNHKGDCKNLHGHSYKLEITIEGNPIEDITNEAYGMLIDFKNLKNIVKAYILDYFDHAYVYNNHAGPKAASIEIANILKKNNMKTVDFDGEPTCETMSKFFFNELDYVFDLNGYTNFKIQKVKLYETSGSFAEYTRPEVKVDA